MRKKPYTERGISRVPCFKCGKPSTQQWQVCSLKNEWHGLCTECDIKLNALVLEFFKVPNADRICKQYASQVKSSHGTGKITRNQAKKAVKAVMDKRC